MSITEINKDTFWTLIEQAKEQCGQDMGASIQWLKNRLLEMGPEQALHFHDIVHGYRDLAYKYGLWTAASIMCEYGCSDDGFMDFRGWLIAQGKEVYLAALKDPDSLADVPAYGGCYFEDLSYVGDYAYKELTGGSAYDRTDPAAERKLLAELKQDIVYGDGIGYPYEGRDVAAYLPRLCHKCFSEEALPLAFGTWNKTSPDIKKAIRREKKSAKVTKDRGDSR